MDEEDQFYNFNFVDSAQLGKNDSQNFLSVENEEYQEQGGQNMMQIKAINPYEVSKNMPEKQRQIYLKMVQHGKIHPGLFHIFEQQNQEEYPGVEAMSELILEDPQQQPFCLDSLFEPHDHNQVIRLEETNNELKKNWQKIHQKFFESAQPHKCITTNFFSRFDNFAYLHGEQNFIKDFEISLINFISQAKGIKGPSPHLITYMYQFWMKMFKSLLQEIFKYSEKYTLDFMKKKKGGQSNSNYEGYSSSNFQGKSANSSRINEFDKRRPWKTSEIQILQKLIKTETIFSSALINRLAEQLNRSPASISSKIQKLTKNRNIQNPDFFVDDSTTMFDRIYAVLKNYPTGITRQNIIDRINEHYEMGVDDSWNKSVAQILSSRPEFIKIKGVYGLNGDQQFDLNKKTFKDKVVNCLLKCPGSCGDLKKLVEVYMQLYGNSQGASIYSQKRKKQIQASFSKALSRYPIFDKSNSKTVYKLKQFCQPQDFDIEIQGYLS